jgi:hypothetical protein
MFKYALGCGPSPSGFLHGGKPSPLRRCSSASEVARENMLEHNAAVRKRLAAKRILKMAAKRPDSPFPPQDDDTGIMGTHGAARNMAPRL